jgi:hypothetical protein
MSSQAPIGRSNDSVFLRRVRALMVRKASPPLSSTV